MTAKITKATEDTFNSLHQIVADSLITEIAAYRNHKDSEGNPQPIALPPALLAQAIKFLKDNGIDSPARAAQVSDALAGKMPEFDPEDSTVVALRRSR